MARAPPSYDYLFRVLMLGDSDVGKSRLLLSFPEIQPQFLITDFRVKTFDLDGKQVKIQLWDTAGQKRFRTIPSSCYRGVRGILLVYDVQNRTSFVNIGEWLQEIYKYCKREDVVITLVGNNDDDNEKKMVSTEEARAYAQKSGLQLFEISSEDHTRTDEMFLAITRKLLQTFKDRKKETSTQQVTPTNTEQTKQSQCTVS